MSKNIKKYQEFINEEVGMKNITSILKNYKEFEIYMHIDFDGIASCLCMKTYLEGYGLKMKDAHVIQYGDIQFSVKQKTPGVLPVLVDFAGFSSNYTLALDHHSETRGKSSVESGYAKAARSNVEIISGEIPNRDIFPHSDVESIRTVDSADFLAKGLTPEAVSNAIFKLDPTKSGSENRFLMGFVVNRLILAYKNKKITVTSLDGKRKHVNKNFLECLALDCNPSLHSLFNNIKHYINNATAENWNKNKREYEIAKLASVEEIEKNHQEYVQRMKTFKDLTIDKEYGIASSYGGGNMFAPGSYDRYTVFKNNPDLNYNCIVWPMGLIQISCNPFKKKPIEDINMGAIAKEVMAKYEPKFKKIFISVADIKRINEGSIDKEEKVAMRQEKEKIERVGFRYEDLVNTYDGVIKYQPRLNEGDKTVENFDPKIKSDYTDSIKSIMNKLYKDLTNEERNILKNIKISSWDIIMANSGGHKAISNLTNFNLLAARREGLKMYFGTEEYTDLMKMIQKDLVENLKSKIDAATKGEEVNTSTDVWGNTSLSESIENESKKPIAKVIGKDGNVFVILGICVKALSNAGQKENAKKLTEKVFKADSYDDALIIMAEYCDLQ